MSTATRFTTKELDERIEAFRSVLDRTTARLVELDADVTRRLLETAHGLRGATAGAWADASRRHAALWQGQLALENLLTTMLEVRGGGRSASPAALVRLDQLLEGASVELPSPPESGRPHLTDAATPTVACSIADAFEQMSADFDVVTEFLAAVARAWGELTDRLHELAASVSDLEKEVRSSGVRRPNDLGALARSLADAESTAQEDPVSLGAADLALLEERARRLGDMAHDVVSQRRADAEELAAADQSIGVGLEALATCRTQLDRWSEKVVVSDATVAELDRLGAELDRLRRECELAQGQGAGVRAGELRLRADGLRDEVMRLATTAAAPMVRRDELRGLLGAYQAKARAVGLAESLEIDDLYMSAHGSLYTAPCNLEDAEQRVQAMQMALRDHHEGSHDGRV
jgi:hypothetical protein